MSLIEITGGTKAEDFKFQPKVWQQHIRAYWLSKLVFGAVATRNDTLNNNAGTGTEVTFPYFKNMGPAQELTEDQIPEIDKIEDDSFKARVKEVGKYAAFSRTSLYTSGAPTATVFDEASAQIGRVMAEKVDNDLLAEFSTAGNYDQSYLAAAATDTMTIRTLNTGKIKAFGDRSDEAVVCYMHSLQFLDLMNDTQAGFLNANAVGPLSMVDGFKGTLLGMAIIVNDKMPKYKDKIGAKEAYTSFIFKPNPYGIIYKQDMLVESDYNMLQRKYVVGATEWYGVKSFHKKFSPLEKLGAAITTTVSAS